MNPVVLTVADAAELLDVPVTTVRRWIRRGDLPIYAVTRSGAYILYSKDVSTTGAKLAARFHETVGA